MSQILKDSLMFFADGRPSYLVLPSLTLSQLSGSEPTFLLYRRKQRQYERQVHFEQTSNTQQRLASKSADKVGQTDETAHAAVSVTIHSY